MKSAFYAVLSCAMAVSPAFSTTLYVDTANNLYTIDTTTGSATQVTLTESSSPFSFAGARGMAFGANGDLYVADYAGNEVYQIDGSGNVTPFAAVNAPYGVATNGSAFLISSFNSAGTISVLDSGGGSLGSFSLTGVNSSYNNLTNVVYGPNGDLYLSSQGAAAVLQYDGTSWTTFATLTLSGAVPTPRGIVFDGDTLFVADSYTNTSGGAGSGIYEFSLSGTDTPDGLTAGSESEFLSTYNDGTKGLILDPSTDDLYAAESVNNEVIQSPDPASFPVILTSPEDFALTATPEPGTMLLTLAGIALALFRRPR
jgi:hypothetical protein